MHCVLWTYPAPPGLTREATEALLALADLRWLARPPENAGDRNGPEP